MSSKRALDEDTSDVIQKFLKLDFETVKNFIPSNLIEAVAIQAGKASHLIGDKYDLEGHNQALETLINEVYNCLHATKEDIDPVILRKLLRTLQVKQAQETQDQDITELNIEWSIFSIPFRFLALLERTNKESNGTIDISPFGGFYVQNVKDQDPYEFEPSDEELQAFGDKWAEICGLKELDPNAWIICVRAVGLALVIRAIEALEKPLSRHVIAEKALLAFKDVIADYEPVLEEEGEEEGEEDEIEGEEGEDEEDDEEDD